MKQNAINTVHFDWEKCDKKCKDIENNLCMMLDIHYWSKCTEDMEYCKAKMIW